jgi:general secretion pathway protein J
MMNSISGGKGADRGFTLLEVLVAVALASIVIIALYSSFFSVLRGQSDIDTSLERTREISRFLETFSKEIQSSFFKADSPWTGFAGTEEDKFGRSLSRLTFTAFTYPAFSANRPAGDLLSIRYYVEDKEGKHVLYKETWNPYADEKTGVLKAEVVEDINGFEILYYNGRDWAKAWDAKLDKTLPGAIKVTLSVKDRGEVKEFSSVARTMIR